MNKQILDAAIAAGIVPPGGTLQNAPDPAALQNFVNTVQPGGFSWDDFSAGAASALASIMFFIMHDLLA